MRKSSVGTKISTSSSFVPAGLRNIGNTCFMASILQPVMATPYLTEYFMTSFRSERHPRSTPLAQTYYQLLETCMHAQDAVTPTAIKNAVSRTVSQFTGYG